MRIESVAIPVLRQIINRPRLADVVFRFDRWGSSFSEEAIADPQIQLELMRKDVPILWRSMYQQWFIMGFDEAREVLSSPQTGTANQIETLLDVRPYNKLAPRSQQFLRNLMLLTDPPKHTRLRGLVNRAFTPRQVGRVEERLGQIADDLIAEWGTGEIEFMAEFATKYPSAVIAELLGLGAEAGPWVARTATTTAQIIDPFTGFDPAEIDAGVDELFDVVVTALEDRRKNPVEDLLTGLAEARTEDGDCLDDDEVVAVAGLVLFAGHETTAAVMGNALLALYENPDQLAWVREDESRWPNAVDELLRFDTSLRSDPRYALEDFEIGGHTIKKGQNIVVLNHAANRDLRRWPDADELRLDRDDVQSISFGHGIHHCLGANLARAELRVALPRVVEALGDYKIDRDQVEWRRSVSIRGALKMPVQRG